MPGIDDAARFVGNEVKRAAKDVKDSAKNVVNDAKSAGAKSAFDIPGSTVASVLKNGGTLGIKLLVLRPAEWIFRASSAMALAGVKTGVDLAKLIPIPLPGGNRNIAQMQASVNDVRQAIQIGARGDTRSLGAIMQDLRTARTTTQPPVTPNANPPPTA
jgi:hypothetical protein